MLGEGGGKRPFSGQGRGPMRRSPRPTRRAWVGLLGRGSQPPAHQLEGLGSSGVRGGSPAAKTFSCMIPAAPDSRSWNLSMAKFGEGGMAPLPP